MKKAAEAALHALGKKKPAAKGKHRITRTTIDHSVNGGHVVRHEFAGGEPADGGQQPEAGPYTMGNMQDLHDHLDQQLGGGNADEGAPAPAE